MNATAQERSEEFAVRTIRMTETLRSRGVPSALLDQVLRSGTSIGANLAEAQCGSSKRDFLSKVRISHKESAETLFWLRVLHRSGFLSTDEYRDVSTSARALHAILSATIRTTTRNLESSAGSISEKRSGKKPSSVSSRSASSTRSPSSSRSSSSNSTSPLTFPSPPISDSFDPFS